MSLNLNGDANDYVGKGLSGGKIIVSTPKESTIIPSYNVIAGNVCFYGATSGEAYINGLAGERFAVRNSGASIVVEGIGDHGCEYMTGGRVVVLGAVGKNFAAGMSGGIAYAFTEDAEAFKNLCNQEMVHIESVQDREEMEQVKEMVQNHLHYTNSSKAAHILENWGEAVNKFVKVIPKDYQLMLNTIQSFIDAGESEEEAQMSAFQVRKGNKAVPTKTLKNMAVQ